MLKIQLNDISCSPFIHKASHLLKENDVLAHFIHKQYNFFFILNFMFKFWDYFTTFLTPSLQHYHYKYFPVYR